MSRSSWVMATGLLRRSLARTLEEPGILSAAACGPAFIRLQIKAGVWAAGDLSGRLRLCDLKDVAGSPPAVWGTGQPYSH